MIIGRRLCDRLSAQYQRDVSNYDRLSCWHKWFAWHPVRLPCGRWAWLETIVRRGVYAKFRYYGGYGGVAVDVKELPEGSEIFDFEDVDRIRFDHKLPEAS